MVAWALCGAARVSVDREGSTAVEYAIIAGAAAVVIVGGFQPLYTRIVALLPTFLL